MRIGLVIPSTSGYSETFFFNKINGLKANGFSVVLFVNAFDKGIKDDSIKIKVAPKLSGNYLRISFVGFYLLVNSLIFHFQATKRLYRFDKADGIPLLQRIKNIISNAHILSESLDWLHFGFGTMALDREHVAAAIGAKMAVSFRGFDIGIYPIKHPDCYKRLWRNVDKIHVISDDIRDLIYKNGFKGDVTVIKITPAIDITFFKNNHEKKHNEIPHIMTVARLHWKKGLDYTLEALALLKQENIPFHYTIIGDGPLYERLKFTTHQLGLTADVTFTGKLSHELVKNKLEQADIYLQYSIQEGFCNSVLEAQAMGLLCVVSDAEGLSENVLDQVTGFVVKKRRPKSLVKKIKEVLIMNEALKENMKKIAKERIKNDFQLSNQIKKFIAFYEEN